MINTREVDVNLLEAEFYEKPFSFSYSSLNTLLNAPGAFYKEYILKQKDEEIKKYLLEGTLIHYLVLEHQGFDEKFMVASDNLPSPNSMLIAEKIYKNHYLSANDDTLELGDFEQQILDLLKEMNLHQSLKDTKDGTGDEKRIAKVVETKTEEYFKFLKTREGKTIIDAATLDKCTRRANIVKADPKIRALLGMDRVSDGRTFGVYNELAVDIPAAEGELFGFRGILDNMTIDVREKLILINDFKTTSKNLTQFTDSVEFWNYWLQAAVYWTLAKHFFQKILTDEWTIEFRFIVFDKYDQLYPFLVTPGTIEEWLEAFEQVKIEAKYHYESRDFSLPYDYAQGNVTL